MTRILSLPSKNGALSPVPCSPIHAWPLQDAKARLSEVVRCAHRDGPQMITVHGREEAVVISAQDYHHLLGEKTGESLITALQASPFRETDLTPNQGMVMPVRSIEL